MSMIFLWGCAASIPETHINISQKRIIKPLPSIFRTKPSPLSRADSSRMSGIVLENYLQAAEFQLRNQHEEALKVYKRILHLDTSAIVFYSMGLSYQALGQTDQAIESNKKALLFQPQFIEAREALAELYVQHEQYDKALLMYKQLDSLNPDTKYTFALAGLTEFLFPEESELYFRKLVNSTGFETEIVNRFGMLLVRNGKENDFIALMREHYAIHPDDSKARSLLIEGLQLYGRSKEALSQIEGFLPTAIDEELEAYYQAILLGIIMRKDTLDMREMIYGHVHNIQSYKTKSWIIFTANALMAEHVGLDISTALHTKAMSLADTSVLQKSIGLAYELMQMEVDKLFVSYCNRYAKHFRSESRFNFLLGVHAREKNNIAVATEHFNEALRRNKNEADAWAQLGGIYDEEHDNQKSDSCYKQALKLDSLNHLYNNNYAYALAERNEQLHTALEMSMIAISQYPDNQSYIDTYAWIQFKLGNTQMAIDMLEKVLNNDIDRNGIIHVHLSIMYQSQSNKEKALIHIEKALDIKDNTEYKNIKEKLLKD